MSKFKVGDRVVVCKSRRWYLSGDCGTIKRIDGNGDCWVQFDVHRTDDGLWCANENKLKLEEQMSRYDEIKKVINNCEGWTKEVDDVLQEIGGTRYKISILTNQENATTREVSIVKYDYSEVHARFSFTTQCSKLTAFKKALMWLLDQSNIKKTLVDKTVKADIDGKTYKVKVLEEL